MGRLDFIYVTGSTSRRLFSACRRSLEIGERRLLVPRAEHLAAMKVQAMKNDPRRALQDMADVQFLLQLPDIDMEEIRGYFVRAGLGEKFDELKRLG